MGIKEIQAVLKHNFDVYATVRVDMLKRLEKEYGRLYVRLGQQNGYENWYYCLDDGIIAFGFSSKGMFMTTPPEQHICLLEITPCDAEDFEEAFNKALSTNFQNPLYRPSEDTIKWMRKDVQEAKNKK